MTLAMLGQFGLKVDLICGSQRLPHSGDHSHLGIDREYPIEPDASSASYFWAAAAIAGERVTVSGLNRTSLQGDVRFVDVLAQMGCRVEECEAGITVHGGKLRGVDVDMNDISDTVMTLGAVACFAEGPTTIRNVAHIRHKETDRIAALATELRKLGAEVEERDDGLTITPRPLTGCAVDTYNDHRMAMSLALVGLKVPGVVIRNPGCVAKTYPGFWQDLESAEWTVSSGEKPPVRLTLDGCPLLTAHCSLSTAYFAFSFAGSTQNGLRRRILYSSFSRCSPVAVSSWLLIFFIFFLRV